MGIILIFALFIFTFVNYLNKQTQIKETKIQISEKLYDKIINGTIDQVKDSVIFVKVDQSNPVDGEVYKLEEIKIDKNTEFFKQSEFTKATEQFAKEQTDYMKLISELKERGIKTILVEAPTWSVYNEIKVEDIHIGDVIIVYGRNESNVIVASKIAVEKKNNNSLSEVFLSMMNKEQVLYGKVNKIQNSNIEVALINTEPGGIKYSSTTIVSVTSGTKYYKKIKKNEKEFAKEQSIYMDNLKTQSSSSGKIIEPPSWYRTESAAIEDILNRDVTILLQSNKSDGSLEVKSIEYISN